MIRWDRLTGAAVAILLATLILLALALADDPKSATPLQRSRSSSVAVRPDPACPGLRKAAVYYRHWAWSWADELQHPRSLPGYRPGRPLRSCARARYLVETWRDIAHRRRVLARRLNGNIRAAILDYFGPEVGRGAIVVAECETGHLLDDIPAALVVRAPGSQYLGIFQMSDRWEIQAWGNWRGVNRYATVIDQVAAAHRMYLARTWQAWACRPDGTVAY